MRRSSSERSAVDRTRRALLSALPALVLSHGRAPAAERRSLEVPTVDRLTLHVVVDAQVFSFAEPLRRADLVVERGSARGNDSGPPSRTLAAEFGFSMLAESIRGDETRRVLVDAGYTPAALANNLALLGLDASTFDALVVSHGHYDHFGGLPALLGDVPGKLRRGTPVHVHRRDVHRGGAASAAGTRRPTLRRHSLRVRRRSGLIVIGSTVRCRSDVRGRRD